MAGSESFEAFYARTVSNVTSQMHALADEDGLADPAIREAYAKAYQQWYQVAGSGDSEAWVLGVARDAYERRRAEAAALRGNPPPAHGHDPFSMPGLFRPVSPAVGPQPAADATPQSHRPAPATTPNADPQATVAPPTPPGPVAPPGSLFGSPAPASVAPAVGPEKTSASAATPGRVWTASAAGRPAGGLLPAVLRSRRNLIAVGAAAAILLAGGIVYAVSGNGGGQHGGSPGTSASAVAKPTVHMLPAGRTAGRGAIPWSLIGPGWTLAEVSTAKPDANGAATGGGRYVIYLVDPEGGRYRILTSAGSTAPELLAWSGNARQALYATGGASAGGAPGYGLLTLSSGQLTSLSLPEGVTALGFTRPDGLNILAVRQWQDKDLLERFTLGGTYAATIGSMPRPAGATDVLQGNALSSPDGTTAVWGISGHEMQLVSNAGGLVRRLRVPGVGNPPACTPLSWWTAQTVLAYCNAAGEPDAGRLWLVPAGGGTPTQLTGLSGSPGGIGDLTGAWQAGGAVYITATTAAQCQSAASGPGGQQILQLGQGGAETAVHLPGSTNDHAAVVAGVGSRLLVLAQTSCPGTSALMWYDPATHAAHPLLTAPPTQVGVVDAVPYGGGPAATTNDLS